MKRSKVERRTEGIECDVHFFGVCFPFLLFGKRETALRGVLGEYQNSRREQDGTYGRIFCWRAFHI